MAKGLNMANYPLRAVLMVFRLLNIGVVRVKRDENGNYAIFSVCPPTKLRYPKGWYYAKGTIRNKHNTSSGAYSEVILLTITGETWERYANFVVDE